MACVQAADRGQAGPDRDDLVGVRVGAGRIDQPGAHPPGAVGQRLVGGVAHPVELGRGRGALLGTDDRQAEHAVTDELDHVDGRPRQIEPCEVLAERPPRPVEVGPEAVTRRPLLGGQGRIAASGAGE